MTVPHVHCVGGPVDHGCRPGRHHVLDVPATSFAKLTKRSAPLRIAAKKRMLTTSAAIVRALLLRGLGVLAPMKGGQHVFRPPPSHRRS
jgi:hypothetical protein